MSVLTEADLKILGEGHPLQVRRVLSSLERMTPERVALINLCERVDRFERAECFVRELLEGALREQRKGGGPHR